LEVESQFLPVKHKIGVLNVLKDQKDEKSIFANSSFSDDFQEFITFLGTLSGFRSI